MIRALYIHIPFCRSKCSYCDFVSFTGMRDLHGRYAGAVQKELTSLAIEHSSDVLLDTVFFGGGTPSVFGIQLLEGLITTIFEEFSFTDYPEISIEVNPGTVQKKDLRVLRDIGFNRLSVGVQSFDDTELAFLGRTHTAEDAESVIREAKGAGFENISLDLMYGLPGQDIASWRRNLDKGLQLDPVHLSLYQLTFEEKTPLGKSLEQNKIREPSDDLIIEMDAYNEERTAANGLHRYEISNFAAAGYECRHNIVYWKNESYLAAGASAVSCINGLRESRVDDPVIYCERVEQDRNTVAEKEKLGRKEAFGETIMMGLRMSRGVSIEEIRKRFSLDISSYYGDTLFPLLEDGLLEFTPTHFRTTAKGRMVLNAILAHLL